MIERGREGGGGNKRGTEMGRMNEKRRERVYRKGRRQKQKTNSAKNDCLFHSPQLAAFQRPHLSADVHSSP